MLFSSTIFLFVFLPLVTAVYFVLPTKRGTDMRWRNLWLLASSLFFYAWGEPTFVLMMLASIVWNYTFGLIVGSLKANEKGRFWALFLAIAGNVIFIGAFKYLNFITAIVRSLFPSWCGVIPQTSIVLPIGISFFTFQALSYVVDVYRGMPAQRSFITLALYVALFPQLVAGPIVRYSTIAAQLSKRVVTSKSFSEGVIRFVVGFNKKMLLANPLSEMADFAFAQQTFSGGVCWLGAICYTLQIYFDFSGYSDMAIGLGRMFGFRFLENFNYPYVSKSFTEFWRRWHISLSSWFRDYVYFPLGGSRVGSRIALVRNLSIVWLLTGIWHGANWTFVLWGCLYGALIIAEKLLAVPKRIESSHLLSLLYCPFVVLGVVCAWVLFRADSVAVAGRYLCSMFTYDGLFTGDAVYCLQEYGCLMLIAAVFACPVYPYLTRFKVMAYCLVVCHFPLFLLGVSSLVMESHNPFIYFSF